MGGVGSMHHIIWMSKTDSLDEAHQLLFEQTNYYMYLCIWLVCEGETFMVLRTLELHCIPYM